MQAIRLVANTGNSVMGTVAIGRFSAFEVLGFPRKPDQLSYVGEVCDLHLRDKGFRRPRARIRYVACPDLLVVFGIFDQSTVRRRFAFISKQPTFAELLVKALNTRRVAFS